MARQPDGVRNSRGSPRRAGFRSVSDQLHADGFLFGVYTDRGPQTCGGRPAAFGHESLDAATYAAWGVDYVKEVRRIGSLWWPGGVGGISTPR